MTDEELEAVSARLVCARLMALGEEEFRAEPRRLENLSAEVPPPP